MKHASVAQSVEQGTENPRVGGSIPPGGTIFSMSAEALIEKIIPFGQGIERRLLETIRWIVSTAVAFAAAKAIPPGEVNSQGCNPCNQKNLLHQVLSFRLNRCRTIPQERNLQT